MAKMIKKVLDLKIYQISLNLVPELYILLEKLPKTELFLIDQSKRSGISVASNIAEGFAKRIFVKEFKRYLLIALASCDELQSHLRIIGLIQPKLASEAQLLMEKYEILAKQINKTQSSWQFMPNTPF